MVYSQLVSKANLTLALSLSLTLTANLNPIEW